MNSNSRASISFCLLTLLAPFAQAQVAPTSPAAEPLENLSFEPIGRGDLLYIYVANSADSTRSVRVSAEGTITLPSLKDPLLVAGLLSTEVEKVLASALTVNKILVEPVVSVSVVQYRSKPVNIVGEVKQPQNMQAIGNLHLLDVIARAGGLTPEAGSQILVSRPNGDGSAGDAQVIPVQALMKRLDPTLNLLLTGGEEIRVPPAGKFFVVGNVKSPGAYQISEAEGTTVLKALALCQGTTEFYRKDAFVYRLYPSSPSRQEITVPIRKIMKREAPDFHLEANDIFYVPDNTGKRITANVFDRISAFGGSTVSGILITGRY